MPFSLITLLIPLSAIGPQLIRVYNKDEENDQEGGDDRNSGVSQYRRSSQTKMAGAIRIVIAGEAVTKETTLKSWTDSTDIGIITAPCQARFDNQNKDLLSDH